MEIEIGLEILNREKECVICKGKYRVLITPFPENQVKTKPLAYICPKCAMKIGKFVNQVRWHHNEVWRLTYDVYTS